jgi:hypothetical protein
MAATPKYGQMLFIGQSGTTYPTDLYVSDVANALIRFDAGAGASSSSETYVSFPERVVLRDFSMVTGTADTTKARILANNTPTSMVLRYDVHVSTNSNRPVLNIGFEKGTRISAFQIA